MASTQPGPGLRPVLVNGELRSAPAPPRGDARRRRRPEHDDLDEASGGRTVAPLAFTVRYRAALVAAAVVATLLVAAALGPTWGLLWIILAATAAVFANLDTAARRPGSLSAYSIFNPHGETLPGQLRADHIEREIRGGFANVVGGDAGGGGGGGGDAMGGQGRLLGGRHEQHGAPAMAAAADQEDRDLQLALERSKAER
jgi:hypothetical protein